MITSQDHHRFGRQADIGISHQAAFAIEDIDVIGDIRTGEHLNLSVPACPLSDVTPAYLYPMRT